MYTTVAGRSQRPQHALAGPEGPSFESAYAWRVLEEIDYGLILVAVDGTLQHANHLARHELARDRFMRAQDGRLAGHNAWQTEEIMRGVQRAAHGRREMILLRNGELNLHVACVPLFHAFEDGGSVLLMLGRQHETHNLALSFFSRSHGLTPSEEAVLKALCEGLRVPEIATAKGVSENTVRTHVRSVRDKTGINSIRAIVQRIAALPPVVPLSLASTPRAAPQDL